MVHVPRRRREAVLLDIGFDKLPGPKARSIAQSLKIRGAGARSVRHGANVYLLPGQEGDFIVCDLVVSVGFARYTGFSMVTVLGFLGNFEENSSFVMRKENILETRFELNFPLFTGPRLAYRHYDARLCDGAKVTPYLAHAQRVIANTLRQQQRRSNSGKQH